MWALAARELAPQLRTDLSYRCLQAITSDQKYYLDAELFIWLAPPVYLEPKSAIVSEGMGTGKTCICLALILTSRHRLAKIDDLAVRNEEISSIRTGRFDELTHESYTDAYQIPEESPPLRRSSPSLPLPARSSPRSTAVPSLKDLSLEVAFSSMHYRQVEQELQHAFGDHLHAHSDVDLPYVWDIPPTKIRDNTRSVVQDARKVYVSGTTLVIVPDILVAQWLAEMKKHVKEGALEYVKIEKNDIVPEPEQLCRLDLVLVAESKIRSEESRFWMPRMFSSFHYLSATIWLRNTGDIV